MRSSPLRLRILFGLFAASIAVFLLVRQSPVSHTGSDPKASLLLSEVILEKGTLRLDGYESYTNGWVIKKKKGHYYYYFPLGTSISALPFVWFETRILHHHMDDPTRDHDAQKLLAALIAVAILLLLYRIARHFLPPLPALGTALFFWLGTSLSSTLGQALWSHDFATLYTLIALDLLLRLTGDESSRPRLTALLLGLVLFMAYLTRPTLSLLVVATVAYLLLHRRFETTLLTLLAAGSGMLLFSAASWHFFGQWLPDYYLPKRLGSDTLGIALWGNLFSPARGLLVYSPFLAVLLLRPDILSRVFRADPGMALFGLWALAHWIVISGFPHWWGGGCYGPRLMTDILPALYLLLVASLPRIFADPQPIRRRVTALFLALTLPFSIYVNACQGLYNPYAAMYWNNEPSVDTHPKYLFDWRYPPFLHDANRHAERMKGR